MKKSVIGIIAHVDAGKTTLAEAMLYKSGKIRKLGRVDNGDTTLDSHSLEKERGITIFAGQSVFSVGETDIYLLDTPGHADFSAETERMMKILDYAILVISGTDGVQAHTHTLWKLLCAYNIPTFVFITKMDFNRFTHDQLINDLKTLDKDLFVDFSDVSSVYENIAMCSESALEEFLENGAVSTDEISRLIYERRCVPCFFGSGLKGDGVDDFLQGLDTYTINKAYSQELGAKVYKVTYDGKGERITHLKLTGGSISVKDTVTIGEASEKINSIRLYSGDRFVNVDSAPAGTVCAVTGLLSANCGDGLGFEKSFGKVILEPVMKYRIVLPAGCDAKTFLPELKKLEAEEPQLNVSWNTFLQEIQVSLMGDIQIEILKSLIYERFDVKVEIDSGRVLYKETITDTVEGVGHFEPLRHYSEVHLVLEPLPRGSGLVICNKCNDEVLSKNWQNLVVMHLKEKEHLGVLTGSPITDMRITLVAGRAHLKHTEGGDFRQSSYRAVRQGLMQASSVLLEPYYSFRLELPSEYIGRAINDIRLMQGDFESSVDDNGYSVLEGKAPVVLMNNYASVVASYTAGRGKLFLDLYGYDICHNTDEVVEEYSYSPEGDTENTPDSVFCAHGSGFNVKWDKVFDYMHIDRCLKPDKDEYQVQLNRQNFQIDEKELEAIMVREFGEDKHPYYRYYHKKSSPEAESPQQEYIQRNKYLIIDGYNLIFATEDLKKLAKDNLGFARDRLLDTLCNYAAFTQTEVIVVFDGYNVSGNLGEKITYNNIKVVYTKENESGDNYIEKLISEIGKNENVRVVTSDNLIRLSAVRFGVLKVSAQDFQKEIARAEEKIDEVLFSINKTRPSKISDLIDILKNKES